jgi:hypothetical protein
MNIKERMARRQQEDIIEIGRVAEKFYNGNAGEFFRAIVNGIVIENISNLQDTITSADRRLGRAEGANQVRDYIELAISEMKKQTDPIFDEVDAERP